MDKKWTDNKQKVYKSWAEKDKSTQKTENGQNWTENRQVDKN